MQIRSLGYVFIGKKCEGDKVCNLETYRIIRRDPALVPNRHIPSAPFVSSNVGLSLFLALAPAELKAKRNPPPQSLQHKSYAFSPFTSTPPSFPPNLHSICFLS